MNDLSAGNFFVSSESQVRQFRSPDLTIHVCVSLPLHRVPRDPICSNREFIPFEATSSWAWSIDPTIYVLEFKNTWEMLDSA